MSVTHHTLQMKDLCDSFGSINIVVYDDEMVHIYLGSLKHKYGVFRTTITRENLKLFQLAIHANGRGEP